jgi:hypothetical protein
LLVLHVFRVSIASLMFFLDRVARVAGKLAGKSKLSF